MVGLSGRTDGRAKLCCIDMTSFAGYNLTIINKGTRWLCVSNIMLTERCNLCCPYCFADEFVNVEHHEITEPNFLKAIDFLVSGKKIGSRVGLIGGEPTLHTRFGDLLRHTLKDDRVKEAVIFTNGILLDETFDITAADKFNYLINLNSPSVMGDKGFDRIVNNIDIIVNRLNKRRSLTVGLNLYDPNMDCSFFVDTLKEYQISHARLSIAVPNHSRSGGFEQFAYMKELVYSLYVDLLYLGIDVIFDCNMPPSCVWTEEEFNKLSLIQANFGSTRRGFDLKANKCRPVIDILPDLTAVRCFGLSDTTKVSIKDFENIDALYDYYKETVDCRLCKLPTTADCRECKMFADGTCFGGCLLNKGSIRGR